MTTERTPLACSADAAFTEWLAGSGGSLVVSTYQAGMVLLIGWNGAQLSLLPRHFEKVTGIDVSEGRLAVAARHEIHCFANAPALAPSLVADAPGRYDALYLPRSTHYTADIHAHDIAYEGDTLWVVNTRFSCLARLSADYSFAPEWKPRFVTALVPEDRCHLNGLALRHGKPRTLSALGSTDTPGGWREHKATGGVLIDLPSGEVVTRGLAMPHSPRWHGDRLYVLNSGCGTLVQVDPDSGAQTVVCQLPGYLRGLSFVGDHALIGLCRIRERKIFGGLPIEAAGTPLRCGVALVDLKRGVLAGLFEFTGGVEELFDIRFLPGLRRPNLLRPDQPAVREAMTTAQVSWWLRPDQLLPDAV